MSLQAAGEASRAPHGPRTTILSFVIDAFGYGAASALALAVDWGSLILMTSYLGLHYLIAAALAFSFGLVVAYVLSVKLVFRGRSKYSASGELFGFLVTGLAGLALNQVLIFAFVGGLNLPVAAAKAPTAVLCFAFNFLSRRFFLFHPTRP